MGRQGGPHGVHGSHRRTGPGSVARRQLARAQRAFDAGKPNSPMKSTASRPRVSLIDVFAYLPEKRVPAEYYANFAGTDDLRGELMRRAPQFRHLARKDESNVDMIQRAVAGVGGAARRGRRVQCRHPAHPLPAPRPLHSGVRRRGRSSARHGAPWVHDVHNGGCAAFVHLVRLARSTLTSPRYPRVPLHGLLDRRLLCRGA